MNVFQAVLMTELRNLLRNKRALLSTFIPIIIIPLIMYFAGGQLTKSTSGESKTIKVAIVNQSTSEDHIVMEYLKTNVFSDDMLPSIEDKDVASEKMEDGKIDVIIEIDDNIENEQQQKNYNLKVVYNSSSIQSSTSTSVIINGIDRYNDKLKEEFLKSYGEDYEKLDIVNYEDISLANYSNHVKADLNSTLALIMPMLILVFVINGGSTIAVDLIAGEKERGSLEALLMTSANRKYIFWAKLITAVLMALVTSTLTTIGYSIAMISSSGGSFNYPLTNYFYLLCTAILTAFMATAVSCYISVTSQTAREAQSKVATFSIIPMLVGACNMFTQSGSTSYISYAVPFLNSYCLLSDAYRMTSLDIYTLLIAFVSSFVVVSILVIASVSILNTERVLIGKQQRL